MRCRVPMAVLMTVAILLGTAVPAHAEELSAGCTRGYRRFEGWAYYVPDGNFHRWYEVQYLLSGPDIGNKSNVNLWVYHGSVVSYQEFSLDDRHPGERYVEPLPPASTYAPANEYMLFEAIFDVGWSGDPRCQSRTMSI